MDGPTYTKRREGLTLTAIKDTKGWEIGYGHNGPEVHLDLGWTQVQAEAAFAEDYAAATRHAAALVGPAWGPLDYVRRAALTDMAYELGFAGLGGFHHLLLAVGQGAWDTAHNACLASTYAVQVPERAGGAAFMLLTGKWPEGFEQ